MTKVNESMKKKKQIKQLKQKNAILLEEKRLLEKVPPNILFPFSMIFWT
ncbi:MAG: hypothetical protein HFJ06_03445 [Lachnospiraceae bacterium]|nr:hypothetical protein [Lachnospiraceae bacterium]